MVDGSYDAPIPISSEQHLQPRHLIDVRLVWVQTTRDAPPRRRIPALRLEYAGGEHEMVITDAPSLKVWAQQISDELKRIANKVN